MKNILLVLIAATALFWACNKEADETIDKPNKEANIAESAGDPKFLVFESVTEYDSILDTLKNFDDSMLIAWTHGFTGYMSRLESNSESQLEADGIYDELLAAIINEQSILQIGEHVFQLNFGTEQVYVLHQTDYDNPSNFDTENPNMDVYSFDDEVLDEVANKKSGTHNIVCGSWTPTNVNTTEGEVCRFVRYEKKGIKFSYWAKMQKNYRWGNTYMEVEAENVRYRKDENANWTTYSNKTVISDYGKWKKNCKIYVYSGSKDMAKREGTFTFSLYWNNGVNYESDVVNVNCQ